MFAIPNLLSRFPSQCSHLSYLRVVNCHSRYWATFMKLCSLSRTMYVSFFTCSKSLVAAQWNESHNVSFIHSWVDYCNAILVGDSDGVIRKLQSVLHAAARLVTVVRWNEHITPTLRDTLHWLPLRHCITYKIATMAFRCVHGAFPADFTDMCIPVETVAGRAKLRSACHGELIVPPTRTKTLGSSSVRSATPTVWNSLPHHIRQSDVSRGQFASRLKTWLFSCAYA